MKPKLINLPDIKSEWLGVFEEEKKSTTDFIINKATSDLIRKRDEALKFKMKENLAKINYFFESEVDFEGFLRKRITLVQFDDSQRDLYLDYESEENKGFFDCFL